jgi:hypothetical protein
VPRKSVESDFQWIKPDGKPTQYFFELIQGLSRNGLTQPVSAVSPTNGQVLVFNATTGLYTPGAN